MTKSVSERPASGFGTRVTAPYLQGMKKQGQRITAVAVYDATFARMAEESGVDVVLIGDSLGMLVQGHVSTLPVTLEHVLYHSAAVVRGVSRVHVVGDMPFLSYQVSADEALRNAGRLLQEAGVHAVKLEGGRAISATIRRVVDAGIPVMGHVGLTPQSIHVMGGFRTQGRTPESAQRIIDDAHAVAEAGAYALVLEGLPHTLAARITNDLEIPTIGIGAGAGCDGQILVGYDLLGLTPGASPSFVKQYDSFYHRGVKAMREFCEDVRRKAYPADVAQVLIANGDRPRP